MSKPDEIRASNLMKTTATALANAARTGAYPNVGAFLTGFSTALAGRLELIDKEQEPTVHAWLSALQSRSSFRSTKTEYR